MIVRPATVQDLIEYTGSLPPCQIRAMAAEIDGKVVGIAGLAFLRNGAVLAFMNAEDVVREHRVKLFRNARRFIKEMAGKGLSRVNAICADDIEAAERFLEHLGFRQVDAGTYQLRAE